MIADRTKNKKIVLGMSGGVDSSVALYLLKKQGFEVIGVSLKFSHWRSNKNKLRENVCCSEKSIQRAKKVCQKYGTPHFIVDATKEFQNAVINYFVQELKNNFTPSPCLFCNRDVKIALLISFAKEQGIGLVATGHYAKVEKTGDKYCLLKAKNKKKDQSYFLAFLKKNNLKKLILPLGNYTYKQVKEIAKREKIKIPEKTSQDLCFINEKNISQFIEKKLSVNPGKIVNVKGDTLGEHNGLYFYTIGQRKGIKLSGGPFWVIGFNKKKNHLIVSSNEKLLFKKEVLLKDLNLFSVLPEKTEVEAKIRYRQPLAKAELLIQEKHAKLVFKKVQRAVTSGQVAVFYKGALCLGGGVIR
jgi:tRNA-uridine 2-sulfurtransferase